MTTYCVYEIKRDALGRPYEEIIATGLSKAQAEAMLPTTWPESGPTMGMREEVRSG